MRSESQPPLYKALQVASAMTCFVQGLNARTCFSEVPCFPRRQLSNKAHKGTKKLLLKVFLDSLVLALSCFVPRRPLNTTQTHQPGNAASWLFCLTLCILSLYIEVPLHSCTGNPFQPCPPCLGLLARTCFLEALFFIRSGPPP